MAAADPLRAVAIPGRLIAGPREAPSSGSAPWGGTELGTFDAFAWSLTSTPALIVDEATGAFDCALEPGNTAVLAFRLHGVDDDAFRLLFPSFVQAGTRSRHARWTTPGRRPPGQTAEDRSITLLLAPKAAQHHHGFLAYAAVPFLADSNRVPISHRERTTIDVQAILLPDSRGRIYDFARLADLVL